MLHIKSFPRRRESNFFKMLWTPASAGVTKKGLFQQILKVLPFLLTSPKKQLASNAKNVISLPAVAFRRGGALATRNLFATVTRFLATLEMTIRLCFFHELPESVAFGQVADF